MNRTECPDFDDLDFEKILTWSKADVTYDDVFVNGKGEEFFRPDKGYWTMHWEHGFIGFNTFKREDERVARIAAAMFIYLWCRGVMASIADPLAVLYARHMQKMESSVCHDASNSGPD